ncbi:MAG: MlaD family protein [Elusimicrobiota bacterium]
MPKEVKLGIFVLCGLAVLLGTIFAIKDIRLEKGYTLYLFLEDTGGLMEKAWVRSSGVKIGKVDRIILDGQRAKVRLWIWGDTKIYADAQASILATGLLGVKYVNMVLGGKQSKVLLKNNEVLQGISPVTTEKMLESAMDSVKGLVDALNSVVGDGKLGENLNEIVDNVRVLTDRLENTIREDDIKQIVDDISSASKDMAKLSSEVLDILEKNRKPAESLVDNVAQASTKLESLLAKVEDKDSVLGKLINDKDVGRQVQETITALEDTANNAQAVLGKLGKINTYWDYRLRYDATTSVFRNDFGLKISPDEGKFYFLGVNNISDANFVDTFQKQNSLTGLIGREFMDRLELYAGVIRSYGGLGLAWQPLKFGWLGIELNAQLFEFSRKVPAALPVGIVGTELSLANWLRCGIQAEDVFGSATWHTYFNVVIEDKDMAYVIALLGLSKP